jgi:hypothetical protein
MQQETNTTPNTATTPDPDWSRNPGPSEAAEHLDRTPSPETTDPGAIVFTPEQVYDHTKQLELCGKGHLVGTHISGKKMKIIPLFCGRWDCPVCGPKKRKIWFARLLSGKPDRLITVTHRPTTEYSPQEAATKLKRTWSRFADNQRRKGRDMEYAWCLQWHKNGFPHLHILQRGAYIPQAELSLYFRKKLNSPIVDIRKNKSKNQAANYIIRYILRSAESDAAAQPKGFRIQTSMNYCLEWDDRKKAQHDEDWTWKFTPGNLKDIIGKIIREHGPQRYHITPTGAVEFFDFVDNPHSIPVWVNCGKSPPGQIPRPPSPPERTLWPEDVIPPRTSLD